MEVIQVQPRDFYLHYVYVPNKKTTIRWTFGTRKNHIAFGLYRRLGNTPLPSSSDFVLKAQQFSPDHLKSSLHNKQKDLNTIIHSIPTNSLIPRSRLTASEKLRNKNEWVELVPIEHVDSAKTKIEGSYTVQDPGNYVLVFDNTFSKNTPKIVAFSVALVDPQTEQTWEFSKEIKCGWLLKKRRKKLQGWAKRWFQLSRNGVLSYSENPDSVTCGSIQVLLSTISLNPTQRLIHIDSGSSLLHLRCTTDKEFKEWTAALKNFRDSIPEQRKRLSSISCSSNGRDTIWSLLQQGICNAELLFNNMNGLKERIDTIIKNHVNDDPDCQSLSEEADLILSLTNAQQSQWHEVQITLQKLLNIETPHMAVSKTNENDLMSNDNLSIISEKFYDAESIILSTDDEDYEYHENIFSDDSFTTTEGEEEETVSENFKNEKTLGESDFVNLISETSNFHRRQILPSVSVTNEVSALSIFRKNIGKDLSQIALPVSMNEPLSILEKSCEELEYSELLDEAASHSNSMDRLMYVAAFAISSYASTQWRTDRKPFNPILTETYECIRPDKGFRFISEKVSHHPLVIASHAESRRYKYYQSTKIKSKFWGKSMEFIADGTFHVYLNDNEHYTFTKPSSWMRNMIAGDKYLEHVGEMKVINQTLGEYGIVTFKEGTGGGIFSVPKERNFVTALFYDSCNEKKKRMIGKWSDSLAEDVDMNGHTLSVIWRVRLPTNPDFTKKYYGFTQFAIELNEITPIEKGKLPKTDSRLRPDQRLYEQGKTSEADKEKLRIENKQRETRALFAEKGIPWEPLWFRLEDTNKENNIEDKDSCQTWQFGGEYWKVRDMGKWPDNTPDLW